MTTVTIDCLPPTKKLVTIQKVELGTTIQVVGTNNKYHGLIGVKTSATTVMYFTNKGLQVSGIMSLDKVVIVDLDINITVK